MTPITQSIRLSSSSSRLLLIFAGLFLGVYSVALTLSPAARLRSWEVDYRWEHWIGYAVWVILVIFTDQQIRQKMHDLDPYLFPVAALLTGWGLLTIWRLFPEFGLRQTIWFGIATLVFLLGSRLQPQLGFLRRYKYILLSAGLILTAMTLVFGTNPTGTDGPRLWLGCCGFYFQPSEPLKLLLIIFLSAYLAGKKPWFSLSTFRSIGNKNTAENSGSNRAATSISLLAPLLFMTGLTLLLLLVQRDLGTATIFLFLFAVITYLATERKIILVLSTLLLALAGLGSYFLFDVVRLRIDAWLNPWLDPSNRSYQIVQSLIAMANGGVGGRGPGLGSPTLVPVSHSDFIFSAIVEEGGLVGGLGLIGLLMLLTASGIRISLRAPDNFRRYLAAGLTAYLIGQSLLIIGGNIRLLPLTGVTLPFVSYGGSSLLTAYVSLLLLALISLSGSAHHQAASNSGVYVKFGGFLLVGLAFAALVIGWWTYQRGPDLLARTDNARRAIADRYVRRGDITDRENSVIVGTSGVTGELERDYRYPGIGSLVGYSHPVYGQSGLESILDPYLRGLEGHSALLVWWHHLLYGQPPPGLDVRLSLDMELQTASDRLMREYSGALVLMNAENGEILSLVSRPGFDPSSLEEDWSLLVNDPNTPLLNRALQGRYSPGTILGPFLLAKISAEEGYQLEGEVPDPGGVGQQDCAIEGRLSSLSDAISSGCYSNVVGLADKLGGEGFSTMLEELGFYSDINLTPGEGPVYSPTAILSPEEVISSQSDFAVSPLQVARAAALLSTGGLMPEPRLAAAVNLPDSGWQVFHPGEPSQRVFSEMNSDDVAELLADDQLPIWQAVSKTKNSENQEISWYIAGTQPGWSGAPLVLVILLEDGAPQEAMEVGRELIGDALQVE